MSIKNIHPRFWVLLVFILAVGALRVANAGAISVFPNFSPLGAMALFGGAYFTDKWKAYVFPLLTFFLSDLLIMQIYFPHLSSGLLYNGITWNYLGIAAMVLCGQLIIRKVTVGKVLIAAFVSAAAHWLISDIGSWLSPFSIDPTTGKAYTHDLQGLINCYVAAIPFMRNLIVANIVYGAIMFGGFEFTRAKFPVLAQQ